MYKSLIVGLLLLSNLAQASNYYICDKVNGIDEWVIHIDATTNIAGFFDNDTWSVVPLKSKSFLDRPIPESIWIFEGKDAAGDPLDLLTIRFNEDRLKAWVSTSDKTWVAVGGCKEIPYPEDPISLNP